MGTLYYNLNLKDDILEKELKNQTVSFDQRKTITRNIKNADGSVTIDLTDLGTEAALYIKTSLAITVTINGQAVEVVDLLFMELAGLTALSLFSFSPSISFFSIWAGLIYFNMFNLDITWKYIIGLKKRDKIGCQDLGASRGIIFFQIFQIQI